MTSRLKFTVGRSIDADVILPSPSDASISRIHLEIEVLSNSLVEAVDRSTNGTWLIRHPGKIKLREGQRKELLMDDLLRMGRSYDVRIRDLVDEAREQRSVHQHEVAPRKTHDGGMTRWVRTDDGRWERLK